LLPFDMWHTAMYEPDGKGLQEALVEWRTGPTEWRTSDKLGFCCFPLQHAAYRYVAFCGRGLVVPVAVMGRIYIGHVMDGLRVDVVWAAEKLMVTGRAAHGVATQEAHILSTKGLRQ